MVVERQGGSGSNTHKLTIVRDERALTAKNAYMRLRQARDGVEHLHHVIHVALTDVRTNRAQQ